MRHSLVGLDIGSSGIRAAEFGIGRRAPMLRRFAAGPLPLGTVRSGKVAEPEALTAALRALWSEARFRSRDVVIGLANDSVLVRQMDLEWMPPADFRKALRYQASESLPVPVDEANLDYHLLEEVGSGGSDDPGRRIARVMLVAAGREMVDGFVVPTQAAGLRVVRADLTPVALVRAASRGVVDEPEVVVDIGAETVAVIVHRAGRPRFVRMMSGLGGETITRALQQRYGWEREDAERSKVALGLVGPDAEQSDDPADLAVRDHPARSVIVEQTHALVAEITATLAFYRASVDAPEPLARVVLAGNGSRLSGLADLVGDELGIPVELLSVLDRVRTKGREFDGEEDALLGVPTGLCLGVAS
jgi:type IV pilus assembly protein PilM